MKDLVLFFSALTGLLSLVAGVYVFLRGRSRPAKNLFLLLTLSLAVWTVAGGMVISSPTLEAKLLWVRIGVLGGLSTASTYLMISFFFPAPRRVVRGATKALTVAFLVYLPAAAGALFLFGGDLFVSGRLSSGIYGIESVRGPLYWPFLLCALAEAGGAMYLYLRERRKVVSVPGRRGLLLLALAPLPLFLTNFLRNLFQGPSLATSQGGLAFLLLLVYGITRYGLFINMRTLTRRLLAHAAVVTANLGALCIILAFYRYALGFRWGPSFLLLALVTVIPFMAAYPAEVGWLQRTIRLAGNRERGEEKLLRELSHTVRTLHDPEELADKVATVVRDAFDLAACALMLREGEKLRVIGYASHVDHVARYFREVVREGHSGYRWKGGIAFESPSGRYSSYWIPGESLSRGGYLLTYMRLGILRVYEGEGRLREFFWREVDEGEAISFPLEVGGEDVGYLWLGGKMDGTRFSVEELDYIIALSAQVAVSLKNSLLLQDFLKNSDRLQELVRRVTTAQEEERGRISRELHDGLAPYFLDIVFRGESLGECLAKGGDARSQLVEILYKAREGLRELRRIIADLRPSSLDVLGLEKSLAAYLERFGVENGMEVEFRPAPSNLALDSLKEVSLFRVAQEALANVARHSRARRVTVSLGEENGEVFVAVEDDGVGFSVEEVKRRAARGDCLGIKGMQERAELLRGDLRIESRPGKGTRVVFTVPTG
jgi:signal transduction histidine kinase